MLQGKDRHSRASMSSGQEANMIGECFEAQGAMFTRERLER